MTGKPEKQTIFHIFQENTGLIRRVLQRFLPSGQDIADLTQETILRALEAEKRTHIEEPKRFLIGIAKNIARKELQKKARFLTDFIADFQTEEYVSDDPAVDDIVDSKQRMRIFGAAITTLPPQCQRVFILRHVYGLSHREIGRKMDISVSTVEKHVAMGLKRCRDFMKESETTHEPEAAILTGQKTIHRDR